MTNLKNLTIKKAIDGLKSKEFSATELVKESISQIEDNQNINAFCDNTFEQALNEAKQSDQKYANNSASNLEGIPVGVKSLFCTKGVLSTSCSKILDGFKPPYESTVTSKLFDSGAIMVGKTSMDELAMGSANTNSCYGPVINPWKRNSDNKDLVPGGSSGGSAAAVSANLCLGSLGSDTGGSIRQPAAFCGNVGVKPTYGRCSRYGMIAFSSSLDQAGVFTKDVEDSALMLQAICGYDSKDSTSSNLQVPDFASLINDGVKGKKIGIPKEYYTEGMNSQINDLWKKGTKLLQEEGAEIIDINLPHTKYALPAYYIIAPAEASANLARYDGVRYGLRVQKEGCSLDEMYEMTRSEGFGDEVKRRIMIGTHVLSSGYYDAYYTKAQKVRRLVCEDFKQAFTQVDAILTPTTPTSAFALDEKLQPLDMYLNDIFTVPASLAGLPAMSVPTGLTSTGLPLGLQIITNAFDEQTMFCVAKSLENLSNFQGL